MALTAAATAALAQSPSQQHPPFNNSPRPELSRPEPSIPCPEYGARFFRAPGSTVCVKIEGRVRGETELRQRGSGLENRTGSQVRADLGFDARTQTDYGPLRMVVRGRGMMGTGSMSP